MGIRADSSAIFELVHMDSIVERWECLGDYVRRAHVARGA